MGKPVNAQQYLKTQIATASPEQLLLMLYDGVIKFLGISRTAIEQNDAAQSHEYLIRSQRIIVELICSLRREIDPSLTDNLTSLYYYIYQLLVRANLEKDINKVNEAIKLLETLREGWRGAVKAVQGSLSQTGTTPQAPLPPSDNSGISLQG